MAESTLLTKLRELAKTPQQNQTEQWLAEVTKLLVNEGGESLADLTAKQQQEIAGQAKEIAKLKDDVESVQKAYRKRFNEIAGHYFAGGDYQGPFASREQARNVGRFFIAVFKRDQKRVAELQREWASGGLWEDPQVAAALSGAESAAAVTPVTGQDGGFLMAEQMVEGIIRNVESYGVFERNARPIPMGTQSGKIIRRTSGLSVTYPDYGEVTSESTPQFGIIKPDLTRYQVHTFVDNSMMMDQLAIALADFIATEMALALALAQDTNAFTGDGTSTYARVTGLLNTASDNDVTASTNNDTFAEVIDLSSEILAQLLGGMPQWADADGNLKWYMHRQIFFRYLGLRDGQDRPLANIFAGSGELRMTLMGTPVEISQVLPSLSDSAASTPMLAAANLARGWVLARHTAGIQFKVSEHYKFLEDQQTLVMSVRQDIKNVDSNAHGRLITAA